MVNGKETEKERKRKESRVSEVNELLRWRKNRSSKT